MALLFDPARVKVLSVRQPWAHLIVSGRKDLENRTWTTAYRGPLYIHAGINMHAMPIAEIEQRYALSIDRSSLCMGAIIGKVDLVDIVRRSTSRWFEGPYGLVLRNPEIISPVPLRGQMGLFEVAETLFR